jgi:hypothetical protein
MRLNISKIEVLEDLSLKICHSSCTFSELWKGWPEQYMSCSELGRLEHCMGIRMDWKWTWWYITVILALKRQKWEDQEYGASQEYTDSSRPAWATLTLSQKYSHQKKKKRESVLKLEQSREFSRCPGTCLHLVWIMILGCVVLFFRGKVTAYSPSPHCFD